MLAQTRSQRQDAELGPRSHVSLSDQLRIDEVGDSQSGDETDGELAGYTFEWTRVRRPRFSTWP